MIYLDTHVVAWLYAGTLNKLSTTARDLIESESLLISPIVQLELDDLPHLSGPPPDSALVLESLSRNIGLEICDLSFGRIIVESIEQRWTRDPFDRLIVAHACLRGARLLTKDRTILKHYSQAIW